MVTLAITVLRWEIVIILLQCVTSKKESLTFSCPTSMVWCNIAHFITYYVLDVSDGRFLDELMIKERNVCRREVSFFFFLLPSHGITYFIVFATAVKNENLRKDSINPYKKVFHPYSQWMSVADLPQLTKVKNYLSHHVETYAPEKTKVSWSLGDEISYIFLSIYIYI